MSCHLRFKAASLYSCKGEDPTTKGNGDKVMTKQPYEYAADGYSFEDEQMSFRVTPNEKTMTMNVKFWYGSENAQCFNGGEYTVPMIEITRRGFEGFFVGSQPRSIEKLTANGDHPNKWSEKRLLALLLDGDLTDVNMDDEFWPFWITENRGNPFGWTTIDDNEKTCTTRYYA